MPSAVPIFKKKLDDKEVFQLYGLIEKNGNILILHISEGTTKYTWNSFLNIISLERQYSKMPPIK